MSEYRVGCSPLTGKIFAGTVRENKDGVAEIDDEEMELPFDIEKRTVIVCDPMLATGGSAIAAIGFMKKYGCKHIKLMCIIGCPEGVARIQKDHPDVDIYVAGLDSHLNDHGYIVPGLGDAGDRIFGDK